MLLVGSKTHKHTVRQSELPTGFFPGSGPCACSLLGEYMTAVSRPPEQQQGRQTHGMCVRLRARVKTRVGQKGATSPQFITCSHFPAFHSHVLCKHQCFLLSRPHAESQGPAIAMHCIISCPKFPMKKKTATGSSWS